MAEFSTIRNTILIVGGGFSGTVLAANLLRRPPPGPSDIVLIERGGDVGRGVAYADRGFPYLLNVPAGRLSADSRDPAQFLRFAQRRLPDAHAEDFLLRTLYGEYLQDVLLRAERAAPAHTRLVRIVDEVRQITPRSGNQPFAANFLGRPAIMANCVILAVGNPPPRLMPWSVPVRGHPAYRHDPWDLPKTLSPENSVLIIGNGLTMADAVLALTEDARRTPKLHTISRHGLLPLPQTAFRPSAVRGDGEEFLARAASLAEMLAMARDLAGEVENRGGDWREVVTFIRHLAPALWQRFPQRERRRFLRHLQVYWDVHRHRMPPQSAARIGHLRRIGQLTVHAGRIVSMAAADERLLVSWRPRGGGLETLEVDLAVNATGPDYALERCAVPLLNSMRAAGLVCADALNLGLRTGRFGACVDAQGHASQCLYYLGPMLRADHWEATAATELRDHAEALAFHLAEPHT